MRRNDRKTIKRKGDFGITLMGVAVLFVAIGQWAWMFGAPQAYTSMVTTQVNDFDTQIQASMVKTHMENGYVQDALRDAAYQGLYEFGQDPIEIAAGENLPPWTDRVDDLDQHVSDTVGSQYIGTLQSGGGCSLNGQNDVSLAFDREETGSGEPTMAFTVDDGGERLHIACSVAKLTLSGGGQSITAQESIGLPEEVIVNRVRYREMHRFAEQVTERIDGELQQSESQLPGTAVVDMCTYDENRCASPETVDSLPSGFNAEGRVEDAFSDMADLEDSLGSEGYAVDITVESVDADVTASRTNAGAKHSSCEAGNTQACNQCSFQNFDPYPPLPAAGGNTWSYTDGDCGGPGTTTRSILNLDISADVTLQVTVRDTANEIPTSDGFVQPQTVVKYTYTAERTTQNGGTQDGGQNNAGNQDSGVQDSDGDGVSDSQDTCANPNYNGPVTDNGCPDGDEDGVPGHQDQCDTPGEYDATDVNNVGCADRDGDGVYYNNDQCENTPSGAEVNDKGCMWRVSLYQDGGAMRIWEDRGSVNVGISESAETSQDNVARLWNEENYQGRRITLAGEAEELGFNDKASSLSVTSLDGSACEVTLYQDSTYNSDGGHTLTCTPDCTCTNDNGATGNCDQLNSNNIPGFNANDWGNAVSAAEVPDGCRLTLYTNQGQNGNKITLAGETTGLGIASFQSIDIKPFR